MSLQPQHLFWLLFKNSLYPHYLSGRFPIISFSLTSVLFFYYKLKHTAQCQIELDLASRLKVRFYLGESKWKKTSKWPHWRHWVGQKIQINQTTISTFTIKLSDNLCRGQQQVGSIKKHKRARCRAILQYSCSHFLATCKRPIIFGEFYFLI